MNAKVDEIAQQLLKRDNELHVTDAVIVAFALADHNSEFFFTRDGRLVDNEIIIKYQKELREKRERNIKLVIRHKFPSSR
jgi:hypothetical protein